MGTDCDIWAFPEGRHPRHESLDRYYVFIDVLNALGVSGGGMNRVTARTMLDALKDTPVEAHSGNNAEYFIYWIEAASRFTERVISRWGEDCPMMIISEDFTPEFFDDSYKIHPAQVRLRRWEKSRRDREQAVRDAEAELVYAQVKDELREKFAHQWD